MSEKCLSEAQLRELLAGTTTSEAQSSAEQHLSTCANCREALERMAGSSAELPSFRKEQITPQRPGSQLLDRAIRKFLNSGLAAPDAADIHEPAIILQHLLPSKYPDSLGRFGDYEILEIIAAGGMGIVLKGKDTSLDRVVAIKVLAPVLAADERARQRFVREARSVAAIRHENVVGIFAVSIASDLPFLAMEYIEGESLAQKLQREGKISFSELLSVAREVAAGLAAAHERGIIHRDIKPGNILIERRTSRVKITDFGLARTVDDTGLTRSGFIAGTPEYLSPEQAAGESVDARSDLFSLGCLLYAMCAGRSPFQAPSTLAVLRRVADHNPPNLSELSGDVPRWFSALVERLLEKKPEDRFASATECLAALQGEGNHTHRPQETPPPRAAKSGRKPLLIGALAGAAAIILAVAFLPQVREPRPFAVLDRSGRTEGRFRDLGGAIAAAASDAVIELRWNGDLKLEPVELPGRSLTLRAGTNFHPVWNHEGSSNAALTARAPLIIEGVEFRHGGTFAHRELAPQGQAGPPPFRSPGRGVFVRSAGSALTLNRCIFQAGEKEDFIGVLFDSMDDLHVFNSEFYFNPGKALVLRGGQEGAPARENSLVIISNCVIEASESIWIGQALRTTVELKLSRSSFKGDSLFFVSEGGTDRLRVTVEHNLFASGVLIRDIRPPFQTDPLRARVIWKDQENLYAVNERLIVRGLRGGGPRRLIDWPFADSMSERSAEADVHFSPKATGREAFRITDAIPRPGGGPLPPQEWPKFGADLDNVGRASRGK